MPALLRTDALRTADANQINEELGFDGPDRGEVGRVVLIGTAGRTALVRRIADTSGLVTLQAYGSKDDAHRFLNGMLATFHTVRSNARLRSEKHGQLST